MLVQGKVKKWYNIIVCLLWQELVHNYHIRMLHNRDSQCFGRMLHCTVQFYHQKNHPVTHGQDIHIMHVLNVVHISGLCDFSKTIAHTCATVRSLKQRLAYQQRILLDQFAKFSTLNLTALRRSTSIYYDLDFTFDMPTPIISCATLQQ